MSYDDIHFQNGLALGKRFSKEAKEFTKDRDELIKIVSNQECQHFSLRAQKFEEVLQKSFIVAGKEDVVAGVISDIAKHSEFYKGFYNQKMYISAGIEYSNLNFLFSKGLSYLKLELAVFLGDIDSLFNRPNEEDSDIE